MLRQSSSRNHSRSRKLRRSHSFQALLLVAVSIWIVYQLTRSYSKPQALVVETDDGEGQPRRRLGRKGFVDLAGKEEGRGDGSYDDPSSKDSDHDGVSDGEEAEDEAADEDDGADDVDDGLAADEDEDDDDDDTDLLSLFGNGEDELKTVIGESDQATMFGTGDDDGTSHREPKESISAVPPAKAIGKEREAAASQQMNTTDGASDGRASTKLLSDSSLRNASSANQSLHDRVTPGGAAKKLMPNGFAVRAAEKPIRAAGAENEKPTDNGSAQENL